MRLSKALCAAVADTFAGGHDKLEAVFRSAGVKSEPPKLAHHSKWKEWLFQVGQDPSVDSLAVLGNLLEEFMDLAPMNDTPEHKAWVVKRTRVEQSLKESGLQYFRFGRILPTGETPGEPRTPGMVTTNDPAKPQAVDEVLAVIVKGLPRAMHPLTHRRKGSSTLSFKSEYDVQDLLHALLRPWVGDIRPEEFTPSYAGTSTRMDFLLPKYELVIETKIVRDRAHAKALGNELIIDIEHYRRHPKCRKLWCVIYDSDQLITNADGLKELEGIRSGGDGTIAVRLFTF